MGTLWTALSAAAEGESEEWLAGEIRLKRKARLYSLFFFLNLNAFHRFIPLFQARVSRNLFPVQKPGCRFHQRGERVCRESPEFLEDDLCFLLVSAHKKIVLVFFLFLLFFCVFFLNDVLI